MFGVNLMVLNIWLMFFLQSNIVIRQRCAQLAVRGEGRRDYIITRLHVPTTARPTFFCSLGTTSMTD